MREKCGLVGIKSYRNENVIPKVIYCLRALQHRGQEAWGIAIANREPFRREGLVTDDPKALKYVYDNYKASTSLGHVRYSTVGKSNIKNAQPLPIGKEFFIIHNGTICNVDDLASEVKEDFILPDWANDTYIVGCRLLQLLRKRVFDWYSALEDLITELNGAYNFIFLTKDNNIYALRDERGFRPLCLGYHRESESYIVASESCALDVVDANLIRDINPGEVIKLDKDGLSSIQLVKSDFHAHCSFEYIYFAHPSSIIEGISVYEARKRVGRELGKLYGGLGDIVIPVPDSARPAATGYSLETNLPLEEGLMKDRYGKRGGIRGFIQPFKKQRIDIAKWITPIKRVVEGKDIVLIDDSIVRGTSSKAIVKSLRKAGTKKINLLVTFPPIRYPCYMGIDFPTQKELIAYKVAKDEDDILKINEKVKKVLGVDFLGYNNQKSLCKSLGLPFNELCLSCTTGDYACLRAKPKYSLRMKKV
ncbi:Amidophosphoribosyltransferase [archaeon HR06]|nr:Amidophosphoribosyltransferase [archaeon HR06]